MHTLRCQHPVRKGSLPVLPFAVLLASTLPQPLALAQTCIDADYGFTDLTGRKKFRIYSPTAGALDNVTQDEFVAAIVAASAEWNDNANSGYFVYDGLTTTESLNTTNICNTADFSIVRIDDTSYQTEHYTAMAIPRCGDGRFEIDFSKESYESEFPGDYDAVVDLWEVGTAYSSTAAAQQWKKDVEGTAVHEFGHVLDLGHPSETWADGAVMFQGGHHNDALKNDPTVRRNLYQWDQKCSTEMAQSASADRVLDIMSGVSGAGGITFYTSPFRTGTIADSTIDRWSTYDTLATSTDVCTYWSAGYYAQCVQSSTYIESEVGIGPKLVTWPDYLPDSQRVFFADYRDTGSGAFLGKHRLRYVRSDDYFVTGSWGGMKHCTSMTGWMTCTATADIFTGEDPAFAYDDNNDVTLLAWVRQGRVDDPYDRYVYVAAGHVTGDRNQRVPVPDTFYVEAVSSPGIACANGQAGGWDCVMVYASASDRRHRVYSKRFDMVAGSTRYTLDYDFSYLVDSANNIGSGSRIAVWYNSGTDKFYTAIRPILAGQRIRVYESSNGASWSLVGSYGTHGYVATGPSAQSMVIGATNRFIFGQ